jgi:hypothetical protein
MGGQIVRPEIGFDLDDAGDTLYVFGMVDEVLAEQIARDRNGIAVIKEAGQLAHDGDMVRHAGAAPNPYRR